MSILRPWKNADCFFLKLKKKCWRNSQYRASCNRSHLKNRRAERGIRTEKVAIQKIKKKIVSLPYSTVYQHQSTALLKYLFKARFITYMPTTFRNVWGTWFSLQPFSCHWENCTYHTSSVLRWRQSLNCKKKITCDTTWTPRMQT